MCEENRCFCDPCGLIHKLFKGDNLIWIVLLLVIFCCCCDN